MELAHSVKMQQSRQMAERKLIESLDDFVMLSESIDRSEVVATKDKFIIIQQANWPRVIKKLVLNKIKVPALGQSGYRFSVKKMFSQHKSELSITACADGIDSRSNEPRNVKYRYFVDTYVPQVDVFISFCIIQNKKMENKNINSIVKEACQLYGIESTIEKVALLVTKEVLYNVTLFGKIDTETTIQPNIKKTLQNLRDEILELVDA